jgi:predicted permease
MIKSFCKEPTLENVKAFGLSAAIGFGAVIISILVARLFFNDKGIEEFASAFCNVGFFGVPLMQATPLGSDGVFYIATVLAFINIGQWTYGVMRITGKSVKEVFSPKKLLLSPFVIATGIGVVLFLTGFGVKMSQIEITKKLVVGVIDGLSVVNTPLAMIIMGVYLAQTDFKSLLTSTSIYMVSLVRLVVIPIALVLVLWGVPKSLFAIKMAVFIAMICPVGANVAVYAEIHGKDYAHAVKTVTMSTIFSIITMPLFIMLADFLWLL